MSAAAARGRGREVAAAGEGRGDDVRGEQGQQRRSGDGQMAPHGAVYRRRRARERSGPKPRLVPRRPDCGAARAGVRGGGARAGVVRRGGCCWLRERGAAADAG